MKRASKKWLSLVTSLAVAFVMCFGTMTVFADEPDSQDDGQQPAVEELSDAEEAVQDESQQPAQDETTDVQQPKAKNVTQKLGEGEEGEGDSASTEPKADLTVSYNGTVIDFFYDSERNQMYYMDGENKEYVNNVEEPITYTAIKNTGSSDPAEDAFGPTVLSMLGVAGLDPAELTDTSKLEVAFTASDGYATKLTWDELFGTTRYTFPNANRPGDPGDNGAAVEPEQKEGAVEVPVLYNLANKDENGEMDPQVCFGQVSPSERNKPNWPSAMMGEGVDKNGNPASAGISVSTVSKFKNADNPSDENVNVEPETEIAYGSEINFGVDPKDSKFKGILYYTTDGTEPTQDSAIYNWYSYDKTYKYNPIVVDKVGTFTVKTKAYRYGNLPSETKTFTYTVRPNLIVSYNGTNIEFFYDSEKNQMYYMDGENKEYVDNVEEPITYTAIKNTGSSDPAENTCGPTVLSMLGVAGLDPAELTDTSKLEVAFTASDGYATKFTWDELFDTTRYSFPNANRPGDPGDNGAAVEPEQKEGAVEVPVLYNLANKDENGEYDPQVCFGQVSPSERNKPNWPKAMNGPGLDKNGNPAMAGISVSTVSKFKSTDNPSDENVSVESGTEVAYGSEINFGVDPKDSKFKGILYYTTDGTEPTQDSAIYNWYSYDKTYKYNPIVVDKVGTFTVKTKAYRYGNLPSEVDEFEYTVPSDLAANNAMITLPDTTVALGTEPTVEVKMGSIVLDSNCYTASFSGTDNFGPDKAEVTVNAEEPFTGTISKTLSVTADLNENDGAMLFNKKTVTAGNTPSVTKVTILGGKQTIDKKYYTTSAPSTKKVGKYKMTVKGKDLVSGSIAREFTVIPAKAVISKASPGKKKATVKIKSQKSSGVTKYQIKYKLSTSKTWKSKTTTSTTKVIKGLKSKKKYNIKVRAYGKTGYGAYSKVKTVKVK